MTVGSPYSDAEVRDQLATNTIAGGQPYLDTLTAGEQITETDADVTVSTAAALITEAQTDGRTVWVADGATIDLTGSSFVTGQDVTIAGNRGQAGAAGPLLFSDSRGENSSAYHGGDGVGVITLLSGGRLTGIRLRGWAHNNWPSDEYPGYVNHEPYEEVYARGVTLDRHDVYRDGYVEVDNCEIYGWATMGTYVGDDTGARGVHGEIHHSDLHDNMMKGYGYHVDTKRGRAHVHHCYLNAHRHALVTFGTAASGYRAEYNVVGPATMDHMFDSHRLGNNLSNSQTSLDPDDDNYRYLAGSDLIIRYNTVCAERTVDAGDGFKDNVHENTVQLNGIPRPYAGQGMLFERNRIEQSGPPASNASGEAIWQTRTREEDGFSLNSEGFTSNIIIRNNQYDGSTVEGDPGYGAPINLQGADPSREYDRHVEIRDAITGAPIEGADVFLFDE